jgi:hypothetical protein
MGDDDQGGGLGGRLSIPMAGVPVPEDDEDGFARLSGLELDEEVDALDADAAFDDAAEAVSASNPPPRLPPVSVRPLPPRAPLPVKRPGSVSSAPRERISNAPPVAFPPPPSEPPPGRGSGIDFEKVLATASMSPPPQPEAPTLDLAMAPPAPSMPVAPRSGGAARTVGLVVLAAAAAFAVAWFLRAPEPEPTLALGPIAGAPPSAEPSVEASDTTETNAAASGVVGATEPAATEPSAIEATDPGVGETSPNEPSSNEPSGTADSTRTDSDATRSDGADTTRADTTRSDTTRSDTTRSDTTRSDTTRSDTTRSDTTRSDTTRADTTRADTTRADTTRSDTTRSDTTRELVRVEPPPPVAPPPPPADLPEEPTRDEVQAALTAIRPAVQSCVQPGAQVRVRITIANSGRVTTAVVEDDYWSRQPHGGCIARAVRTASFPRFARDRFVVVFPFQF